MQTSSQKMPLSPLTQPAQSSANSSTVDETVLEQQHTVFFNWCETEIARLRKNHHVFILLSCMISIRVRYKLTMELEFRAELKNMITQQLNFTFQQFYTLLLDICCVLFDVRYLQPAGRSMESYDEMFSNEVLCMCVQEMTETTLRIYNPEHRLGIGGAIVLNAKINSWVSCLQKHDEGMRRKPTPVTLTEAAGSKKPRKNKVAELHAAMLAARPPAPPPKIYITMPPHTPSLIVECMELKHGIWIRIMLIFSERLSHSLHKIIAQYNSVA